MKAINHTLKHTKKQATKVAIASALSLALTACGGSSISSETPAPPAASPMAKYQGIWLAPSYGKGIDIKNNELTLFDYTQDFCFVDEEFDDLDADDLAHAFNLSNDELQLEQKEGYGAGDIYAPGAIFSKEESMPAPCALGFMPQLGDDNFTLNVEQDLAYFYQTFKEFSVSIELQQVDWEDLYTAAQQKLAAEPTEAVLLDVLVDMIRPLKDGHTGLGDDLEITFPNKPYFTNLLFNEFLETNELTHIENASQEQAAIAYIREQYNLMNEIIFDYADSDTGIKIDDSDNLIWFEVDGIGYLQIAGMDGYADDDDSAEQLANLDSALDQALTDLQYTQGLIIDIRRNMGGNDFVSLAIASRFIDQQLFAYQKQARLGYSRTAIREVHISPRGNIQYLNPIALLTSATTSSAAEVFTMTMKNLPQVTLMGEATQGEFSDVLEKTLPSGLNFGLSNEYYLTTTGDWLEGQGVPVDIELPTFSKAERLAEVDLILEAAFNLLSAQ